MNNISVFVYFDSEIRNSFQEIKLGEKKIGEIHEDKIHETI